MDFEIDESRIFYGLGAFLGVVSILYFGHELIFDLSPTVKTVLLLSGTGIFLAASDIVENGLLKSSFYIFSAFSYLVFLLYMFARFEFTSGQVFTVLAVSSAVFTGLGYIRSGSEKNFSKENSKKVLGALIAVLAVLVILDVTGAQPEYETSFKDDVRIAQGQEFSVGVLEVRNDFLLSRNIDLPVFQGCVSKSAGAQPRSIYISPDSSGIIGGAEEKTFNLTEELNSRPDENVTFTGNYTVKQGECPEKLENSTIYVQESNGNSLIRSAVD